MTEGEIYQLLLLTPANKKCGDGGGLDSESGTIARQHMYYY